MMAPVLDGVSDGENNNMFGFAEHKDLTNKNACESNQTREINQHSTDIKVNTLPTLDSVISTVSSTFVDRSAISKRKHENDFNNNERIAHEIDLQIKTSESKIMNAMQSLLNVALEGQKEINCTIENLSKRIDDMEKNSFSSSPSNSRHNHQASSSCLDCDILEENRDDIIDLLRKASHKNSVHVNFIQIDCFF